MKEHISKRRLAGADLYPDGETKKFAEHIKKLEAEEDARLPPLGYISYTPDGKFLAVGHCDGTMAFWEPPSQGRRKGNKEKGSEGSEEGKK